MEVDMTSFLKGNYQLAKETQKKRVTRKTATRLTEQFEESALARLGGSMCFVIKDKTFMWVGKQSEASGA
jgi:hypothetical protein